MSSGLIDDREFTFLWVTDFPMFEWDDEEQRWSAKHHPFTRPTDEWKARGSPTSPRKALAHAYDIIVNGNELGGGSFRIHEPDIQARVFDLLALTEEQQRAQFGFLLDALAMGAPPHGGIALGIDRMTMVLAGEPNLRDVIAFPKNQAGVDPMSGAPSAITQEQLDELGLAVVVEEDAELSARVVVRLLALAAVALLRARRGRRRRAARRREIPVAAEGAVAAGGGWYDALAAPRPPAGTPSARPAVSRSRPGRSV